MKGNDVHKLRTVLVPLVIPLLLLAAAAVFGASPAGAANAVTVVGTVNAGGTSVMTDLPPGMNNTSFSFHATLFSDGTAKGHIDCVDHMGDVPGYPGNIFGDIVSWTQDSQGLHLHVSDGRLVAIPGGPVVPGGLPFTVTIQTAGGAGVGHWTLAIPNESSPPICTELLVSGQIKIDGITL